MDLNTPRIEKSGENGFTLKLLRLKEEIKGEIKKMFYGQV